MIVRLLQNFSSVSLAREAQPPKTIPPESWADVPGRQSIEKVRPGTHLTMFVDVSVFLRFRPCTVEVDIGLSSAPGWSLGKTWRSRGSKGDDVKAMPTVRHPIKDRCCLGSEASNRIVSTSCILTLRAFLLRVYLYSSSNHVQNFSTMLRITSANCLTCGSSELLSLAGQWDVFDLRHS